MSTVVPFAVPPVVKVVHVACTPAQAFERFTSEIHRWWPTHSHALKPDDVVTVVFEPRVGGRIFERWRGGEEGLWGMVTAWEPGARVAFTWHVGRAPETAQHVEVSFAPQGAGTEVRLVHSGWEALGDQAEALRNNYEGGWELVFVQCYARHAAGAAPAVHHITHPLIQHKLTLMRQKDRSTNSFRRLLGEISMLMAYEVTRDMPTSLIEIETPLEKMMSPVIDGKKTVFVSIMRAGAGFLDGMLNVVPGARIGHIGLYRDPKTLVAVEYYFKMPAEMHERDAIVLDPMLATGNSAVAAVDRLKETNPRSIRFVCLLAAPEGLRNFHANHPDVPVYTAAIDRALDEHGYIVPGLGDAGDRIFGTK